MPETEITVVILLSPVASAVAMATKWVRMPYTLALVGRRQLARVERHLLAVKKARLAHLSRQGMLSEEVHRELGREFDRDRLNVEVGDQ